MTLRDFEDSSNDQIKGPCQFFVHIENLPWSASPRDVKAFFYGLDISPGGISILGRNAFVSFERWDDMRTALLRDNHAFHGQKLFLSVVDLKLMREINANHIHRSSYLMSLISTPSTVIKDMDPLNRHRKIRPTALTPDRTKPNTAFVPDEIDSPAKGLGTGGEAATMKSVCPRKRIKPTPLSKTHDSDSSLVFTQCSFLSDGNFEKLICH